LVSVLDKTAEQTVATPLHQSLGDAEVSANAADILRSIQK
jgi:hypothetical protein